MTKAKRGFEYTKNYLEGVGSESDFAYFEIPLPTRSTQNSAGYDFYCPIQKTVVPGEYVTIKTGIKAFMPVNEVLLLAARSSLAIKRNLLLINGVGVIDSDYYSNVDNDGEIMFVYKNIGKEEVTIKLGDKIGQGIFVEFKTCGDVVETKRTGGVGSTGK